MRQQKSVPILRDLGLWLQQQYVQVLPKSEIGKAIAYSLQRWERLSIYATDGRLNIDNNPVENRKSKDWACVLSVCFGIHFLGFELQEGEICTVGGGVDGNVLQIRFKPIIKYSCSLIKKLHKLK